MAEVSGDGPAATAPGGDPGGSTVEISESTDPSGAVVLALRGEIDLSSVPHLQAELDRVLAAKPDTIVFEMSALSFMDSSGIAALLGCAGQVGDVQVRNPSTAVRRVIELSGLTATLRMSP
jgi:anti-anti-sigma factor